MMQRASLFTIRAILLSVDKGSERSQKARFTEIAFCTPELRNRKRITQYLRLLVDELGWLEKKQEARKTRFNPVKNQARHRQWTVSFYCLTESGKAFLELFPSDLVIPAPRAQEDDEDLPTPEEQARNWEAFQRGEWNLATPDDF